MVREGRLLDVSEMAIVTYLMARNYNEPMVLLPDVVMARFPHGHCCVLQRQLGMGTLDA